MLRGMVGLPAAALFVPPLSSGRAEAATLPTAQVNTSGLAVSGSEVTVGILHSTSGTKPR